MTRSHARREPLGRSKADRATLRWLLEEEEPSIRLRTLTEIVGRPGNDPEVREARRLVPERGWAAKILAARRPWGGWDEPDSQYRPKYLSTNWMMLILSDLGLTRAHPEVQELCELWMGGFAARGGGLGGSSMGTPHYCVAANMARALVRFGYAHDDRVRRTFDWLVDQADPKGGWSCFGSGRNLDSWEALSAFAVYPRSKWTRAVQDAVEKGAEFFLERELHRQGSRYRPWFRLHYPVHYYYDLLVGLDFMTALGYAADPRMAYATRFLRSRRRRDGRWNLDAVHPDVEGAVARWFASHPKHRPIPFALERVGRPSKMITFTAWKVLSAAERAEQGVGEAA